MLNKENGKESNKPDNQNGKGEEMQGRQQPKPAPLWKAPDATMAEGLSAAKQKRILYVEDKEAQRRIGTRIFSSLGYAVSAAASAEDALDIFDREHFDLIVTDFDMGGMNGRQLAAKVKARNPNMPVIIISGMEENEDFCKDCKDVDAFLPKPFKIDALASLSKRLIEESEKKKEMNEGQKGISEGS